ncbi:MAG: GtrA family protein [Planctomycetes bacterium]|nr:GtrA family protein [Planctomycetota bacterium]MCB9903622.1 GtrA family protein [Planctomycetota bacterium]
MKSPSTTSSTPSPKPSELEELKRLTRFVLVGGFNTACMYALFVLLVALGVHHALALVADYAGGLLLGYALNRGWTFADRDGVPGSRARYFAVYLLIYGVNAGLLEVGVRGLHLAPALAQLPALAIATGTSYLLQRVWVFRPH